MPITPTRYIWFRGELVPWEQATVHVMTHALHYGSSIFEGLRCYDTPEGPALFRLTPHIRRLFDSARIYRMHIPFSPEEMRAACRAVIHENGLKSAYVRPLAWRGYGDVGVSPLNSPVEVMVAAYEWKNLLGPEARERGVEAGVSSWSRPAPNTLPVMAKAGGNYLSSALIMMEAAQHGYAEGIALDVAGQLSEGGAENLFLVRDGVLYTPPVAGAILPGITRDTVIALARQRGYEVRETTIPREALYVADEVFFCGTAAEVSPIRSVDGIPVGSGRRGPVTAELQRLFFGLFSGETEDRRGWLEYVGPQAQLAEQPLPAAAAREEVSLHV